MSRARKKKADMNSLGVVLSPGGLAGAALSSRRDGLARRASHRTGLAGRASDSLDRCLRSGGPGRWPGQSGKELGLTERLLHSLVEPQAAEVSRYCSGVLYNTDQKRGSKFRCGCSEQ